MAASPVAVERAGRVVLSGEIVAIECVNDDFQHGTLRPGSTGRNVRFVAIDLPPCPVGATARLTGYWETHPVHGRQLRVMDAWTQRPTEKDAVVRYIVANITGCGIARAGRIVSVLGVDCLERIERDPAIVASVFSGGLGHALSESCRRWAVESRRDTKAKTLSVRLLAAGVKYGTIRKVTSAFATAEAAEIATLRHPYRLLDVPDVGWATADRIALILGVRRDAPERLEAACRHVLARASSEGHAGLPDAQIARRVADLVGMSECAPAVTSAVCQLEENGVAVRVGPILCDPEASDTEWRIAEVIGRLARQRRDLSPGQWDDVERVIGGSNLSATQATAVHMALSNCVSVLTGRPGSGKTTTLKTYLQCCDALGWSVQVVAPTGKAASRAAMVTGKPAGTVHRTLGGLARGDASIMARAVVVDEASMCDAETAAWLLSAVDVTRTSVLWTGDVDQLPSVGYGAVLRDLIESGRLPVTRLVEIYRQAAASRIVRNAHRLLDGEALDLSPVSDWDFHEVGGNAAYALQVLTRIVQKYAKGAAGPRHEFQVLAPLKRGPLGVESLNTTLQQLLNPRGAVGPMIGGAARARLGDRVVATRNMYDLPAPLYNGEQGVVIAVNRRGRSLTIRVDEREVVLRGVQCLMVRLAWAITVHRSQGSEYSHAVLLYDHQAHKPMLDVGVLYTAITRAKARFTLIGSREAVVRTQHAAKRRERYTGLATYLRSCA